jgi:hypothetical protein
MDLEQSGMTAWGTPRPTWGQAVAAQRPSIPDSEFHRAAVEGRRMVTTGQGVPGFPEPGEMQSRQLDETARMTGLYPAGTGRFNTPNSQPAQSPLTHPYPLEGNGVKVLHRVDPWWDTSKPEPAKAPAPAAPAAAGKAAPASKGRPARRPRHRSHPIHFEHVPDVETLGHVGRSWVNPY